MPYLNGDDIGLRFTTGPSSPKRVSKATFQFSVKCLPLVLGFPPDGCTVVTVKLHSVDREERTDRGSQKQQMSHEAAYFSCGEIDEKVVLIGPRRRPKATRSNEQGASGALEPKEMEHREAHHLEGTGYFCRPKHTGRRPP